MRPWLLGALDSMGRHSGRALSSNTVHPPPSSPANRSKSGHDNHPQLALYHHSHVGGFRCTLLRRCTSGTVRGKTPAIWPAVRRMRRDRAAEDVSVHRFAQMRAQYLRRPPTDRTGCRQRGLCYTAGSGRDPVPSFCVGVRKASGSCETVKL